MKLEDVILIDTRTNQPAASAVPVGSLFAVTDEGNIVERSNGSSWDSYSPGASDRISNAPLTTPSSPANGDLWVEASGSTPNRVVEVKLRDGGVTYTILTFTY